nr:hypothetical protein [Bacteroidota bacterium]
MTKKITLLISVILLFSGLQLFAGKGKAFTGTITYKIGYSDQKMDENLKGMLPTIMKMYIGEGKIKTDLFTEMGTQSIILDLENKSKTALMSIMGTNMAITSEWEEIQEEYKRYPEVQLEYLDETREIAGYVCKKIKILMTEETSSKTTESIAWFTEELNVNPDVNFSNPIFRDVKGMLMEYELDQGNGNMMKFTAIEVDKGKINKKEFIIPDDYELTTREQLINMFSK